MDLARALNLNAVPRTRGRILYVLLVILISQGPLSSLGKMPLEDHRGNGMGVPPGQKQIRRILRWGRDHPAIASVPEIDVKKWVLVVDGEVETPLKLSWEELLGLPSIETIVDFHCVEGWSVLGIRWVGVSFSHMLKLVKPKATAKFALFLCADGYTTSLPLEDLKADKVLLAYKANGEYLAKDIGAPLRLVLPDKYAYKSPMWINKIALTAHKELGYWEKRGYSDSADVWANDRFSS